MHHRNSIWLSAICTLGLVLPVAADDKETIDKLQKENAELRKLLERERELAKLNELTTALKVKRLEKEQAEAAQRIADENAKTAAQIQKAAEAAAKEAEARRDEAKRVLELADKER